MEYSPDFSSADPSTWDSCSYEHHPAEDIEGPEWPESSEFRQACISLLCILQCVDTHMCNTRDARMAWTQISFALGLKSTQGLTITSVAERMGVTKQAVSRGTVTFLRMVMLPPAFGLKSQAARRTYQSSNGCKPDPDSIEPNHAPGD
jgi:hypothetical protein